jgi:putative ABC transport system ATP-binding protein
MTAAASDAALEAVDLTRRYQLDGVAVEALRGVSLRIGRGEFVAIIGPSGSGKSTLMHLLGCLDRPTSGRLRVNGVEMSQLSDTQLAELRNKTIGFVFQSFHLMPHRSALENVTLAMVYNRSGRADRTARARAALTRVGLGHRIDALPTRLSGGERQRVAIARALVARPSLLLCDEPTGNLDTATAESVLALLDELHAEGMTVLVITHDPAVAAHGERTVAIRDGVLAEQPGRGPRRALLPQGVAE